MSFKMTKVNVMLRDMLSYCRPEGSRTQREFCKRYIEPVFGLPDEHGNYILQVGNRPTVAFMAHHDTVHSVQGYQKVELTDMGVLRLHENSQSACLGADCTTGVWLILEMVRAGVKGTYVIHAGEEIGCVGSRALVQDNPEWLDYTEAAISFDRKGRESIITHQLGQRTCSDTFAFSLAEVVGLPLEPDDTGSFTDSNEYAHLVPECTNLSVGYFNQHTKSETQDLEFATQLRDQLIKADWDLLVIDRDPEVVEMWEYSYNDVGYNDSYDLYELIETQPEDVADVLACYGITDASTLRSAIRDLNYYTGWKAA